MAFDPNEFSFTANLNLGGNFKQTIASSSKLFDRLSVSWVKMSKTTKFASDTFTKSLNLRKNSLTMAYRGTKMYQMGQKMLNIETREFARLAQASTKKLSEMVKVFKDGKGHLKQFKDDLKDIKNHFKETGSNIGQDVSGIKNSIAGIGGVVAGALAIDKIMDFEKAMGDLRAYSSTIGQSFKQTEKDITGVSKALQVGREDAINLSKDLYIAGLRGKELMAGAMAAREMHTNLGLAEEAAGAFANEMLMTNKLSITQFKKLGGAALAAVNAGFIGRQDIADFITSDEFLKKMRGLPAQMAEATGKGMIEAFAAGGTINKETGQAFADLIGNLGVVADEKSDLLRAQLSNVLPNIDELLKNKDYGQVGMGIVKMIKSNIGRKDFNEMKVFYQQLFGESIDEDLLKSITTMDPRNIQKVTSAIKQAGASTKVWDRNAAENENTWSRLVQKFERLRDSALEAAQKSIADVLLPKLNMLLGPGGAIEKINNFFEKVTGGNAQTFYVMAGGATALTVALGALYPVLSGTFRLITGVGGAAFKLASAIKKLLIPATDEMAVANTTRLAPSFAALNLPLLPIIAGITALVAIGWSLYNLFNKYPEVFEKVIEPFKEMWFVGVQSFTEIKASLSSVWNEINSAFPIIGEMFNNFGNWVKSLGIDFSNVGDVVSLVVGVFVNLLGNTLLPTFNFVFGVVTGIITEFSSMFSNVMYIGQNVVGFFSNVFAGQWSDAWDNIKNIFSGVWTFMTNALTSLPRIIINALTKAFSANTWGRVILKGIVALLKKIEAIPGIGPLITKGLAQFGVSSSNIESILTKQTAASTAAKATTVTEGSAKYRQGSANTGSGGSRGGGGGSVFSGGAIRSFLGVPGNVNESSGGAYGNASLASQASARGVSKLTRLPGKYGTGFFQGKVAQDYIRFQEAWKAKTGKYFKIVSHFRPSTEADKRNMGWVYGSSQEALRAKYGPGRANRPGFSLHEAGLAMDVAGGLGKNKAFRQMAAQFGFMGISGEDWHFSHTLGGRYNAAKDARAVQDFKAVQGIGGMADIGTASVGGGGGGGFGGFMQNMFSQGGGGGMPEMGADFSAMIGGGLPFSASMPPMPTGVPGNVNEPTGGIVKGISSSLASTVSNIGSKYGLSGNFMQTMAMIESGGRANVGTNKSGYTGLYQFGKGEWAKFGGGGNINDASAQAHAAAKYALHNRKAIEAGLKKNGINMPWQDWMYYLAHNQGAAGAVSILTAASKGTGVSGTIARNMANQGFMGQKTSNPTQFLSNIKSHYASKGGSTTTPSGTGGMPSYNYESVATSPSPAAPTYQQNDGSMAMMIDVLKRIEAAIVTGNSSNVGLLSKLRGDRDPFATALATGSYGSGG